MFPVALAKSGRQVAISISPADGQGQGLSFHGERGLEGTVLAALWAEGQEKETSFLESMGRARERKGRGGGGARINRLCFCYRAGTRKASSRPGRSHQHPRRGVRKAGGAVRRLKAELKVSSRGGRKLPVASPPRLTSRGAAVGPEGYRKRQPGPEGHQAAPITRASGRGRPAVRSARLGAEGAASGWALLRPLLGPPGTANPPPTNPQRGTCTARLRKVPASAANFFTLKSMMFILGGSRAELPADLAGRRRRRGRAGAPGGSGGDRRGRWREAAPALLPQLSFPSRRRERGWGEGRERAPPSGSS